VTVRECVDGGVRLLTDAGFPIDEARLDAAVLARHALGWSLAEWAAGSRDDAPPAFAEELRGLITRRAAREPVAYITGKRDFYGRTFRVSPAVLIPRPETEGIVEAALPLLRGIELTIADIGTGSGCLAITLALECPRARIVATDTSVAALDVARENARAMDARVEFVQAEWLPADLTSIDLIITNPPYVPEHDRASLMADVRDFEPASALFAGPDGLDAIRVLLPIAARALKPGGSLIMEIGAGHDSQVAELIVRAGLHLERIRPDLAGIPRVVVAKRPLKDQEI